MGNPSFLKLFASDSLTHDCAIIFSGGFRLVHIGVRIANEDKNKTLFR